MNKLMVVLNSTNPNAAWVTCPTLSLTLAIWYSLISWNISCQRGAGCWWITYHAETEAVPQRAAIIKDAKTMYDLLVENFSHPAASSFNACMKSAQLNWHVFFHVLVTGEGAVQQNRPGCHFKTLKGIRKLLCVKSLPQQEKLLVRFRSG